MTNPTPSNDSGAAAAAASLVAISEVKGQLAAIMLLIQSGQDATNRRIDDMASAMDTRFTGIEGRLGTLEANERDTARRTAVAGAISGLMSGALVSGALALLKRGG